MNRHEIEALLFRVAVTFPSATTSEVERRARVEEWLDSAVADVHPDRAEQAWRDWKDSRDWPPTPHQFAALARQISVRGLAEIEAVPDPEISDEERERVLVQARQLRAEVARIPKTPGDDRPSERHPTGALVHSRRRRR